MILSADDRFAVWRRAARPATMAGVVLAACIVLGLIVYPHIDEATHPSYYFYAYGLIVPPLLLFIADVDSVLECTGP